MEMKRYNHYIRVRGDGCVIEAWSDGFSADREKTEDDILLTSDGDFYFRLPSPLFDGMSMIPLYKYENGEVVKRTDEELTADREAWAAEQARLAAMPTREDRIEAQVTYTAMCTDTMLPEEDEDDV